MTDFMTVLGNLTLTASLAVLLVLAVRVLLARLPKRYLTFLWLPVFLPGGVFGFISVAFQSLPDSEWSAGLSLDRRQNDLYSGRIPERKDNSSAGAHRKRTERWKGRSGCKCGDGNGGRSRGYIGKYPVWNLAGRRDSGVALRSVFLAAAAQEDCSGSEAGRGRL